MNMATSYNLEIFVTPKKGKEKEVLELLEKESSEWGYESGPAGRAAGCEVEEAGKSGASEHSLICNNVHGSYSQAHDYPIEMADKLDGLIKEGKIFMKEIEPASGAFLADTAADLVTRIRKDRSNKFFEEKF